MTALERTDGARKHWIPVLALFTAYWTNHESVFCLYVQSVNVYYRRWQQFFVPCTISAESQKRAWAFSHVMFGIILQLLASWEITRLFDSFVNRVRRMACAFLSQSENTLCLWIILHIWVCWHQVVWLVLEGQGIGERLCGWRNGGALILWLKSPKWNWRTNWRDAILNIFRPKWCSCGAHFRSPDLLSLCKHIHLAIIRCFPNCCFLTTVIFVVRLCC